MSRDSTAAKQSSSQSNTRAGPLNWSRFIPATFTIAPSGASVPFRPTTPPVGLIGVEPLGRGTGVGEHAATMTYGREGIIHGFRCYLLQDEEGQPSPVYSCASGLDYPGVGPEHSFLKDVGRVEYVTATDDECRDAFFALSRKEGIIPALESAHAVAHALVKAREMGTGTILVNLSGRGDKDMDYVIENWGIGG